MDDANPTRQDDAVAARLRKLSTFPVDLGRLERRIQSEIPRPTRGWRTLRWARPVAAVAASIAIVAIVAGAFFWSGGGQVMASPAQMAQFHQEILADKIPVTRVDSIEAAGQVLSAQWPHGPDLPRAPEAHVMACCMNSIENRKVACVLLNSEGTPITMSVAKASDMRAAMGKKVIHNRAKYHVASSNAVNMVSTERNGRWVCLIGETSSERLMAIAEQLQF